MPRRVSERQFDFTRESQTSPLPSRGYLLLLMRCRGIRRTRGVLADVYMTTPSSTTGCPLSIGIMGTPMTSGNRGVHALASALVRLCLESGPSVKVAVFGCHPRAESIALRPQGTAISVPVIHWRMSPRGGLRNHLVVIALSSFIYRFVTVGALRRRIASAIPWIGELEQTDIVGDVRGGDSFSDIYGLKRFLIASLDVLSVLWVKRGLVLFPQTYGPFKSGTTRLIARWIIRSSIFVIARDRASQCIAQELAGPRRTVLLSPDVAFALHVESMESAEFDGSVEPVPTGAIGLNVNGLMFNGGYTGRNMFGLKLEYRTFVTELATRLLAEHPGPLLLVPHTYAPAGDVESDNDANRLLKESLPIVLQARVRIVTGDYDAHQLKGIIGRCGFFVGSRMHSCIAALSQGVPCVGVAYSMKFRGVFETVGMAAWVVDGRETSNDVAVASIIELYRRRQVCCADLGAAVATAQVQLRSVFSNLAEYALRHTHLSVPSR
jgi:colanic acid/amylovoran biosynthesis protein